MVQHSQKYIIFSTDPLEEIICVVMVVRPQGNLELVKAFKIILILLQSLKSRENLEFSNPLQNPGKIL